MKQAIVRWTFYLAAFFLIGPLAAALLGDLRGPDGSTDATPLVSTTPALGLMLALAALAIAAGLGALAARLVGSAAGLSTAGIIAAWAAFRTGTVDELIRTAQSGRPLLSLAVEGALLGIIGLAIAWLILRAGRRADSAPVMSAAPAPAPPPVPPVPPVSPFTRGDMAAIPAALIGGALGAAFIAGSPVKGQAIAAAIIGGIGVGVAARLTSGRAAAAGAGGDGGGGGGGGGGGIPAMFIAIAALAILGPLSGYVMAGNAIAAAYKGSLFPLAWITPLDWVAGGLLGIPIGIGWAHSLGEKTADKKPTAPPRTGP